MPFTNATYLLIGVIHTAIIASTNHVSSEQNNNAINKKTMLHAAGQNRDLVGDSAFVIIAFSPSLSDAHILQIFGPEVDDAVR